MYNDMHFPFIHRRTSTPRSEDNDQLTCKDHTGGIVVLAFNTKTERIVHRGTCLGEFLSFLKYNFYQ